MALRSLLTHLKKDPVFAQACGRLSGETPWQAWITGLWGSGRAFFWAGIRECVRRPMLLVLPTADEARELYDQVRLFLGHPDPEREEIFLFPGRELLPYEHALTDMETLGERLEVLDRLARGETPVVVTAMEQIRELLPDPVWLLERTLTLTVGQNMDPQNLAGELVERGYVRETTVTERGEFAVRGGILDVFCPADLAPWRLEFEGTELVSLRRFSVRAAEAAPPAPATEARITPARLFAPTAREWEEGWSRLERREGRQTVRPLRDTLDRDCARPGAEYYLPEFQPTATLADYLPAGTVAVLESPVTARQQSGQEDERNRQLYQEHRRREPLLPAPEALFRPFEDTLSVLNRGTLIRAGRLKQSAVPEDEALPQSGVVLKSTSPLRGNLDLMLREARALLDQGLSLNLVAHNRAEERRLKQVLAERASHLDLPDLLGHVEFHAGQLAEGFQYPAAGLVVFTDQELFNRKLGRPVSRRLRGAVYASQPVTDVLELKAGDLAVHRDHGIARYAGVVKLAVDGGEHEFVCLVYGGDEKLYVPTDQLRLVEKHIGEQAPRLHRLGSGAWERAKQRVRESVAVLARQLLDVYAARQVHAAHAFGPDTPAQREFEESFPYEETPDQARAILEVKKDMESPKPMDRLICGDVGFGKTEVAMRAAFKAVQEGLQVAVLVPTTLLADQHYATFRERMAAYPVRIELFSRFRTAGEQRVLLRDLAQGAVDIVVGTHKLLGKDIAFRRLGLFVVDEEQHFGVAQKERLKKIRATVDVLTLTATPIPRTLYLSLSGIRDISIIETPPLNRLPIRTAVVEYSDSVIREAILREMSRGGQIFFIHNRVQSIGQVAERIKTLVPEARIAVAHGQMSRDDIEPVMEKFLARADDVLVSTTIVESGLDMPNVNTILINRADALGMAQLYQLRGRVGRADRQAYAYLFYPVGGAATGDAEKRLTTLQEFTELGSGFKIAMRDLEIRGAGDVLGPEQSGQVSAVGFETYCSLLEEAVRELRGQREETPADVKVSVPVDAYLPSDYLPDTMSRLTWYKRLGGVRTPAELDAIIVELEQRVGTLPAPAAALVAVAALKLDARAAGVTDIVVGPRSVQLRWPPHYRPAPDMVERLLANRGRRLRFLPGDPPGLEAERPPGDIVAGVRKLLSELK